jgi:hypothetical protein
LTQYKRLADKFGRNIPPNRLKKLDQLRDSGEIKITDIPGGLRDDFPEGVFDNKTLKEIKELCGQ